MLTSRQTSSSGIVHISIVHITRIIISKSLVYRLESIKDLVLGKPMMLVLLKLFGFAVNVAANRQELIKPELNTITVLLRALNLALWAEQESGSTATKGQTITEQILQIIETIMLEASSQSTEKYTVSRDW